MQRLCVRSGRPVGSAYTLSAYGLHVTFARRATALVSTLVTMSAVCAGCSGPSHPSSDSTPVFTKTLACPAALVGGGGRTVDVVLSEVSPAPHAVTLRVGQRLRVRTTAIGSTLPRPIHVVDRGLSVQHVMCLIRETTSHTSRVSVFVAVTTGLVSVADFPDRFAPEAATPYTSVTVNVL